MNKNTVFTIIALAAVWVLLKENVLLSTIVAGIVLSICCVFFCRRFLPLVRSKNINPFWLPVYLFFVIFQVYLAGLKTIKLIFTGADAEIIDIKTGLSNDFIKTILANSITLIPGSISLALKNDTITVLWLKEKKLDLQDAQKDGESIKSKLEKILLKVEG